MLADQKGEYVQQNQEGDRTWFAVGRGFENNVLLKAFHQGVVREGPRTVAFSSDRYLEVYGAVESIGAVASGAT